MPKKIGRPGPRKKEVPIEERVLKKFPDLDKEVGDPYKEFTDDEIMEMVKRTDGDLQVTAKLLGCDVLYIHYRMGKNPDIRRVWGVCRRSLVDLAETKLRGAVKKGNLAAVFFTLKTLGKKRGYVERTETRIGGDRSAPPIKTESSTTFDISKLPLEVRMVILQELEKVQVLEQAQLESTTTTTSEE